MTLSIVIPVLNEAANIVGSLQALQPWRPYIELIVVDGGSRDDSVALALPLADKVICAEPGRARQMNAGALEARGQYLLFLHADTQLPKTLPELLPTWSDLRVAWGFFPLRLSGSHWLLRCVERGVNWRSRLTSVATGDQCLFVDRKVFASLGGYPDQPLMEDVALSKILRLNSQPRIERWPVVSSSRRWEARGIVRTILLMWRLRLAYFLGVDSEVLARRYYPDYVCSDRDRNAREEHEDKSSRSHFS